MRLPPNEPDDYDPMHALQQLYYTNETWMRPARHPPPPPCVVAVEGPFCRMCGCSRPGQDGAESVAWRLIGAARRGHGRALRGGTRCLPPVVRVVSATAASGRALPDRARFIPPSSPLLSPSLFVFPFCHDHRPPSSSGVAMRLRHRCGVTVRSTRESLRFTGRVTHDADNPILTPSAVHDWRQLITCTTS